MACVSLYKLRLGAVGGAERGLDSTTPLPDEEGLLLRTTREVTSVSDPPITPTPPCTPPPLVCTTPSIRVPPAVVA